MDNSIKIREKITNKKTMETMGFKKSKYFWYDLVIVRNYTYNSDWCRSYGTKLETRISLLNV
jgi:hypothetical protein